MYKMYALGFVVVLGLAGCATVPMGDPNQDAALKQFSRKPDVAGLYIFRDQNAVLNTMDLEVDGRPIGATAAKTYMYVELPPGNHVVTSKTEDTASIEIQVAAGRLYFIWQQTRVGVWRPRSALVLVREDEGKKAVRSARLAIRQ